MASIETTDSVLDWEWPYPNIHIFAITLFVFFEIMLLDFKDLIKYPVQFALIKYVNIL